MRERDQLRQKGLRPPKRAGPGAEAVWDLLERAANAIDALYHWRVSLCVLVGVLLMALALWCFPDREVGRLVGIVVLVLSVAAGLVWDWRS